MQAALRQWIILAPARGFINPHFRFVDLAGVAGPYESSIQVAEHSAGMVFSVRSRVRSFNRFLTNNSRASDAIPLDPAS